MLAVSFAHTRSPRVLDLSQDFLSSFTWARHHIAFVVAALRHPFPSSLWSRSSPRHPDGRQWFRVVIVGKTCCCSRGVKYVCCTMCVILSGFACSVFLWLTSGPSLQRQLKSFLLSNSSFSFLSHYALHPPLFFLFSSQGSYLFSASGQNNSSQLTPISSPTLSLSLLPLFFFYLSITTGPTGGKRYFKWMVSTLAKHLPPTPFRWF